jgi:hypothetical protein
MSDSNLAPIEIVKTNVTVFPNLGRYFFADLSCGKHNISVSMSPTEVRVIVQNASNRAWRGMGKTFPSIDAALANYKTPAVRAMIRAASLANQEAA